MHEIDEKFQRRGEWGKSLARLAANLNMQPDLDRMLTIACEELASALGVSVAYVAIYDEASDSYQAAKIIDMTSSPVKSAFAPIPRAALDQLGLKQGQPMLIANIQDTPTVTDPGLPFREMNRPSLMAGLFHEDRRIGVMSVSSTNLRRAYSQEDITLLQTFADQTAAAIVHARLFATLQRQETRLLLINEITQVALESGDLRGMLDLLARRMVETMRVEGCYIYWWDAARAALVPYSAFGQESQAFLAASLASIYQAACRSLLEKSRVVFAQTTEHSAEATSGRRASLALRLQVGEQKLGGIIIVYREPHPLVLEADSERWEELALQVSLTIAKVLSIQEEKQHRREAETMQNATAALASSLDLEEVLETILSCIEQVVPFNQARVLLNEAGSLRTASTRGLEGPGGEEDASQIYRLVQGRQHGTSPLILDDTRALPGRSGWHIPRGAGMRSWMLLPLIAHGSSIGVLALAHQEANCYSDNHARLAQAFAGHAAVAIANARLFEQVRSGRERMQTLSKKLVEVQEDERRFLSHELHDEIGQVLTGLQFSLEMIKRTASEAQALTIIEAQNQVRGLMAQVRELSSNLRPAMLDELGLLAALQGHFERYQKQTGIHVHFNQSGLDRRFPNEIEVAAFRVIQEGLTNAARYAAVGEIFVRAAADRQKLIVEVEDRGQGFDTGILADSHRAFGLAGMRERTSLVGGAFQVLSQPQKGTHIIAAYPMVDRLERRKHDRASAAGR